MAIPVLPTSFEERYADYEGLSIAERNGFNYVRWPLLDLRLKAPHWDISGDYPPSIREIAPLNRTMKIHGQCGFSLGRYHEFIVTDIVNYQATLNVGGGIATIGSITPLAALLFWADERDDIHGEIEFWKTIRLQDVAPSRLEPVLLTALEAFSANHMRPIGVQSLEIPKDTWQFVEGLDSKPEAIRPIKSVPSDVKALRLFYFGARHEEHVAAFLQFYRILEHYAHNLAVKTVANLRRKPIPDGEFASRAATLLRQRDETAIVALVKTLPCNRIMKQAVKKGLIAHASVGELATKVYAFRNSVVHAKDDYRAQLFVQSPIEDNLQAEEWRNVAQYLSKAAIARYAKALP